MIGEPQGNVVPPSPVNRMAALQRRGEQESRRCNRPSGGARAERAGSTAAMNRHRQKCRSAN